MNVPLGRTIIRDFVCHTTANVVSDAASLPTCEIFEDVTDTAILTPTVVKRVGKTGNYRVSIDVTVANGFEIGKSYNVIITATVGTTQGKAVIASFDIDNIILKRGTVVTDGSNSVTTFKTDLSESVNDVHKDALILFTSGTLINQVKKVSAYNGTSKFITVGAFTAIPTSGDAFILLVY